ncbi:hypothetical protein HY477_00075 [Candidatus Uhrbacteria bacterium]|nr:hypothetical protein [Candidatus Uhrbacteria bacterium]
MLRLPIDGDPGLSGGCNLPTTLVLLSIVSGVSITVFDPAALTRRQDRGMLFKELFVKHYPWNEEQHLRDAKLGEGAADVLYDLFRNPLAHALGVIDPKHDLKNQLVVIEKGSNSEDFIESLETSNTRPISWNVPTLREHRSELVLWVASLYWGVRKMIYNVACIHASPISPVTIPQAQGLIPRST